MRAKVGDWVEVRSKEEILRTLDSKGRLDGLPFMPQMFHYCGQRFKVYKRAHKTCDTVNYHRGGGRRLHNGVHLDTRCDGEAYGGCQAACLIFWKEAWLKPVKGGNAKALKLGSEADSKGRSGDFANCTEADVQAGTRAELEQPGEEIRYVCQATLLPSFTTYLPWWDVRQYLEDYTSGNVTLGRLLSGFLYFGFNRLVRGRVRSARPLHWLYNRFQALRGGVPYPRRTGSVPVGQPTPKSSLNLQPGELVRVKSFEEILSTLDTSGKNGGLYFDAELVPYCGGIYRVRSRVDKIIDEKTGKKLTIKTPSIILEGVWCQSRYSHCRLACPRSIFPWWREVWLERVV